MWVNEGTPTMSFVLYTINVEYLCDSSYVTWKYRQYRRYPVIFVRKYITFQKINIPGARLNSSGTSFFVLWTYIMIRYITSSFGNNYFRSGKRFFESYSWIFHSRRIVEGLQTYGYLSIILYLKGIGMNTMYSCYNFFSLIFKNSVSRQMNRGVSKSNCEPDLEWIKDTLGYKLSQVEY